MGKKEVKGLQIGSYEGRSACWLLVNVLTGVGSSLECVDLYNFEGGKEVEARFRNNTKRFGDRVRLHVMDSMSWALVPSSREMRFDFIYIDGDHDPARVLQDAALLFDLLNEGGIMIINDYLWEKKYPRERPLIVLKGGFLAIYSKRLELLHKGYRVEIKKKTYVNL